MAAALVLTLLMGTASAGWWDKGRELLEDFGVEEQASRALSDGEIGDGLKEALRVGSERVVGQLGQTDGFNGDPKIHIPLPKSLKKVNKALSAIGMGSMLDDLELKLNRAAERATPKAKRLFVDAISEMTLDDVKKIYSGPDDAATQYFRSKMSAPLSKEMLPIVEGTLNEVGAVKSYDRVVGKYESLPFVGDVKSDLNGYVVDKGMDGIFHYQAREEAAIRNNPAERTTELLKKVFGR